MEEMSENVITKITGGHSEKIEGVHHPETKTEIKHETHTHHEEKPIEKA
jgi:uncharacterized alkaline shock family protein YloU